MNEREPKRIVIEHANGFTMINTRLLELSIKLYVLPIQCKQGFDPQVPNKIDYSCVVRYEPKGRSVKYIVIEEYDNEENDKMM